MENQTVTVKITGNAYVSEVTLNAVLIDPEFIKFNEIAHGSEEPTEERIQEVILETIEQEVRHKEQLAMLEVKRRELVANINLNKLYSMFDEEWLSERVDNMEQKHLDRFVCWLESLPVEGELDYSEARLQLLTSEEQDREIERLNRELAKVSRENFRLGVKNVLLRLETWMYSCANWMLSALVVEVDEDKRLVKMCDSLFKR